MLRQNSIQNDLIDLIQDLTSEVSQKNPESWIFCWQFYHAFIPGPECVQCGEVPKRRVHLDVFELQRNVLHCYGVQDTGGNSKWELRVLLRRLLRLQPRLWTDEQSEQHVHRAGHLHPWHRCRPMHLQDLSFWDSLQVEAGIYQSYSHSTCRQPLRCISTISSTIIVFQVMQVTMR